MSIFNATLTNEDIMHLLAKPSSEINLKNRLMADYAVTERKKKRQTRKKNNY